MREIEIWKNVVLDDIKNYYKISNLGRVKGKDGRILKLRINNSGYYIVDLRRKSGGAKTILVHRLVAIHFLDNMNNKECVNHKNGDKRNCKKRNLEWNTYSENNYHALHTGLREKQKGENHSRSTLTESDAKNICILLEKNIDYDTIAKNLNLLHISNIKSKIKMIKCGFAWNHISKLYNISNTRNDVKRKYSDNLVHLICQCFSQGMSRKETRKFLNLEKNESIDKLLYSIYKKKKHLKIVENYEW